MSVQKFSLLAWFKVPSDAKRKNNWKPTIIESNKVKVSFSQYGTDDNGKTYYYDAVVFAENVTDVNTWICNQNNFLRLSEEGIEKVESD